MKALFNLITLTSLALIITSNLFGQKISEENLLGCWKIKSVEFMESTADSSEIVNGATKMITCFEKNGKFTTKIRQEKDEIVIGTGTFSISSDGKTIIQKRDAEDEGVDAPAEVIRITNKEFSIKVEQLILHFERLSL